MPYIPNTPESRFQRTDSKNPATTCQGLTNDGRRCRRPVSKLPQLSSPLNSAQVSIDEGSGYCWQHRDQANPQPQAPSVLHRTSLDTLVSRLGILDIKPSKNAQKSHKSRPSKKTNGSSNHTSVRMQKPDSSRRRQQQQQQQNTLFGLCCFGTTDKQITPARPIKHNRPPPNSAQAAVSNGSGRAHSNQNVPRPVQSKHGISVTKELLSLIPSSASPEIASQLLAVLAKPPSEKDSEGFIYMFWLTPESLLDQPSTKTASMLLTSSRSNPESLNPSDLLDKFTSSRSSNGGKKILLKIGRARNVYRRLNQWTKQCGYNLSLIRYYPYISANSQSKDLKNPSDIPIKVPHVNKVERLIHIEINSKRAHHERCEACGKEHKEWFEVDASREGVREIDKIIRRWVDWNVQVGTS